jgi:hypothetical protein
VALGLTAATLTAPTWAAFKGTASNPGNAIAAAPDFRAPAASATVVLKSQGGTPGFVKKSGTYTVLAQVTDTGNPASGIAGVTADASTPTSGATAVALNAGSFSAAGVSYNRGTASLTAGAGLTEGAKSYSLTSTDVAANTRTQTGYTVTVDNTAPTASDVQTANNGTTVGRPQTGDTITFTFGEPIEPGSILSGWAGDSTNVVVRITDGGCVLVLCSNDTLTVRNSANAADLPLGSVDLKRPDYRGGSILQILTLSPIDFGRSTDAAPRSTMVMSGNKVTVTLGTPSTTTDTAGANGTMTWAPSATPYDRAANAATTASVNESGGADTEF